jgi:hypothetical protein
MDDLDFDPREAAAEAEVDEVVGAVGRRSEPPRRRFVLEDDTGFNEVPRKYRRFYRRWLGEDDVLAPNEVLCPVCKVVIRSSREVRVGDRVYCMPCLSRLTVVRGENGRLEGRTRFAA